MEEIEVLTQDIAHFTDWRFWRLGYSLNYLLAVAKECRINAQDEEAYIYLRGVPFKAFGHVILVTPPGAKFPLALEITIVDPQDKSIKVNVVRNMQADPAAEKDFIIPEGFLLQVSGVDLK